VDGSKKPHEIGGIVASYHIVDGGDLAVVIESQELIRDMYIILLQTITIWVCIGNNIIDLDTYNLHLCTFQELLLKVIE
jgi:hypothetical protein